MSHVFISYSREEDQPYARKLADELRKQDIEVWLDDNVDYGARWWRTIVKQVRTCAAFIVLMTPESEESEWVEREILLAEDEGKPILPLLLRGKRNPLLGSRQYADVTDGRMPPKAFYDDLRRAMPTSEPEAEPSVESPPTPKRRAKVPEVEPSVKSPPARPRRSKKSAEKPPEAPHAGFEPQTVPIPAGRFLMGSTEKQAVQAVERGASKGWMKREQPQHTVELSAYWIGKYPVTNVEYQAFVRDAGREPPQRWDGDAYPEGKGDHPVVYVSWEDATVYCRWLSEKTGKEYRLPTEAQWEKAARGDDGRIYPWGNDWDAARLNSAEGGRSDTSSVGQYSPDGDSPYGCADVAGNVWEWCADWFDKEAYERRAGDDVSEPKGPEEGTTRVLRGGAFDFNGDLVRCAVRHWYLPYHRLNLRGFRVFLLP